MNANFVAKIRAFFTASFCDYALALILSLIALILCVWQVDNGHNWGGDFSGYIAQAIALANGTTEQYIADNTLMMSKCDWLYGPYAYPWGFPALLAIAYKIFGFNIVAFKSVGVICYTIFVGIFYIFCANRLPRIYALFATLLFAINPTMTNFVVNEILSDTPFLLFGFIALIILTQLFNKTPKYTMGGGRSNDDSICSTSSLLGGVSETNTTKQSKNQKIDCHDLPKASLAMTGRVDSSLRSEAKAIYYSHNDDSAHSTSSLRGKAEAIYYSRNNGVLIAAFGGIFMLFATMIRINGFVILCALITMHSILLAKRFAPNLFKAKILKPFSHIDSPYSWQINAIPYVIFVVGFIIVSITLSSGGSGHWQHLADISLKNILYNLDFYIYALATFRDFLMIDIRVKDIVFVLSIFLYYIALRSLSNDNRFAENIFYIIFALGFFALLIIWIVIMWPRFVYLLLPFLVFGCAKGIAFLNANNKIFGRIISVIILAILAHSTYNQLSSLGDNIIENEAYTKEAKEMWAFIDNNTPKNAVILFHKPRVLYLNAHRISFASNNIARFDEVDFVLWEKDLWRGYKAININSNEFLERTELIYKNAQFKLFKVIKQ